MKRMAGASTSDYQEDRFSLLPDVLLVCILSFVDTRLAVQTSILSKRWENVWKMIPSLNLDPFGIASFDLFVEKVLSLRDSSIKIESINIKVTNYKILDRVFYYVLSHGINKLSVDTSRDYGGIHSIPPWSASDILCSLSLKGTVELGKSLTFKRLVTLRLEGVRFVQAEPFSCYPNLKELFLVNCMLMSGFGGLQVVGSKLLKLIISSCFNDPIPYERIVLVTPKLVVFELNGLVPVLVEGFDLPDLNTIHIDCFYSTSVLEPDRSQQKLNLIATLKCLSKAKCVHLSQTTAEILSTSHNLMIQEKCSFNNLKLLNFIPSSNEHEPVDAFVANYLRKDCPQAVLETWPRY